MAKNKSRILIRVIYVDLILSQGRKVVFHKKGYFKLFFPLAVGKINTRASNKLLTYKIIKCVG